jgi:hypothetical protein
MSRNLSVLALLSFGLVMIVSLKKMLQYYIWRPYNYYVVNKKYLGAPGAALQATRRGKARHDF